MAKARKKRPSAKRARPPRAARRADTDEQVRSLLDAVVEALVRGFEERARRAAPAGKPQDATPANEEVVAPAGIDVPAARPADDHGAESAWAWLEEQRRLRRLN